MYIYKIWASNAIDSEDECSYFKYFDEKPSDYELEDAAGDYAEDMIGANGWAEADYGWDFEGKE